MRQSTSAAKSLEPLFFVIANVVGSIMALGALFAALKTMYAAVNVQHRLRQLDA